MHHVLLARRQPTAQTLNVKGLGAGQAQGFVGLSIAKLQRQHAHADQVGTVNSLEALGDHGLHAQE